MIYYRRRDVLWTSERSRIHDDHSSALSSCQDGMPFPDGDVYQRMDSDNVYSSNVPAIRSRSQEWVHQDRTLQDQHVANRYRKLNRESQKG